jgi:hypothetical protein
MKSEKKNMDNDIKDPCRANRGLVNGNGFTNGLSSKNAPLSGKGLVNGNGLTNGNGVGPRNYSRIPMIRSKKMRNRIIGVILAIVLIFAPLLIYVVEFNDPPSGMLIDGNFSDWEDQEGYADSADDVDNPNINIVEYNMIKNGNNVNIYVEVEGDVLKGTDAKVTDTLSIFIDSDTDASTGYSINGMGADYMLEAQGRSGRIINSEVRIFDPHYRTYDGTIRDQNDWNGWTDLQNGEIKCVGNQLETRIRLYDTKETRTKIKDNVFVSIRLADLDGNEDYSDTIMSTEKVSLIARQNPIADQVISGDQSEILEVELTAVGKDVTVDRINFEHTGAGELMTDELPVTVNKDSTIRLKVRVDTTNSDRSSAESVRVGRINTRDNVPVRLTGTGASAYVDEVPNVIRIDGAFADWDNVPAQTDDIGEESVNNNPNIDLVEQKNNQDNEKLSFYMKVDGSIMEGAKILSKPLVWEKSESKNENNDASEQKNKIEPLPDKVGDDSAYVFIDIDQNDQTGYINDEMEIGADYMIEITGQDGRILSKTVYSYSQTSNNNRLWSWEQKYNEILAATDSTQLEAQIDVNAFGLIEGQEVNVYYMMTDWDGNRDSSGEPISFSIASVENLLFREYKLGRGPQATIDYQDGVIDGAWSSIAVDINDGNDVNPPNGGDILTVKVCDNATVNNNVMSNTWINFWMDFQAGPISENVFIYLDTNNDTVADWALSLDVDIGGFAIPAGTYFQWSGSAWNYINITPFEWPGGSNDQFEIGINLSKIGNITSFNYYVETRTGSTSMAPDTPTTGTLHDRAPNTGWQTYVVIPEFSVLMLPVISTVFMVFILYRRRRKVIRSKKEVV